MISVCIATYNGASYIQEQLDSILPQLGSGDEVIVSDDASTDGTLALVAAFESPILKVVKGPCKGSPVLNFENALRHASGDIIFLSDQDDRWEERKVARMVEALAEADCVVSDCYVTDGELNVTAASFYELNATRSGRMYNLLRKNGYLGCCMAFRREVLEKSMPFPAGIPMHDIWIGNVAAFWFRTKFIDDRLIRFRRHSRNSSVTARKSPFSCWRKLEFRWLIVRALGGLFFRR